MGNPLNISINDDLITTLVSVIDFSLLYNVSDYYKLVADNPHFAGIAQSSTNSKELAQHLPILEYYDSLPDF